MSSGDFDYQSFAQALSIPTQEALQILPQVQRQPEAWDFAYELLSSENVNCQFFGAHTLQIKIAKDWDSLEKERQDSLKQELIALVAKASSSPLHVLNKINQALATYALYTVPDYWDDFLQTVIEAIQIQAANIGISQTNIGYAIIDLLDVFPEEIMRTNISNERNARFVHDIKNSLPFVLNILVSVVQGVSSNGQSTDIPDFVRGLRPSSVWRARAWKAILQWLQFGIPGDTLFVPLIEMSIQQLKILSSYRLNSDGASQNTSVTDDEINGAISVVEDMVGNVQMSGKYGRTIGTLILNQFSEPWLSDIIGKCINDCDDDGALQWSSVLISFCETYTDFIIGNTANEQFSGQIKLILRVMLALTKFPGHHGIDENMADQTLNFWYLLQETLVDYEFDVSDDEQHSMALEETKKIISCNFFELLKVLISKLTFPPTEVWLGSDKDEKDKFLSYRREVADGLLNTYYVLRDKMLQLLVDETINSLSSFTLDNWQAVDSLLFSLKSIGEAVPDNESAILPRLFNFNTLSRHFLPILQHTPSIEGYSAQWSLTAIRSSILSLIGAYGEWWKCHPESLPIVVPCVTSSLNQPALVTTAVAAFRRICDSCREQLTDASDGMVHLAREVILSGSSVPIREQQRIFESVAEVIMALPPEQQIPYVTLLSDLLLEKLKIGISLLESAAPETSPSDLESYLRPLLDHLSLVESMARGLQFSDEAEETALLGEPESVALLVHAAEYYHNSNTLHQFRSSLVELMRRIVSLPVWTSNISPRLILIDDELLERMLAIINSSFRRGPHAFAFQFKDVLLLIREMWNTIVASSDNSNNIVHSTQWTDKCPIFLQCISQLVTVSASSSGKWQLSKLNDVDTNSALGEILSRAINDTTRGITKESENLITAIEQQPVITESVFDLSTKVLQVYPVLFVYIERSSVAEICNLSIQALSVPNRLALKPTAYFLSALIRLAGKSANNNFGSSGPDIFTLLWNEYGSSWLRITLLAIGGTHPRSLLPNLSELLFSMVKNNPTTTRQWINELFIQQDFPSPHVNSNEKRQFLQQSLSTRSFMRFKGIVSDFSIKCRNLQGTAYVA